MGDIGAPPRLTAGAPGGGGASGNAGRVVNPPAALLQAGGEAVPGTVVGRNAQGQLLVRGDFGQGATMLAIATAARFPAGMAVALNFRPHVSGLFVTIVPRTVLDGGRPPAGPASHATQAAQTTQAAGRAAAAAPPQPWPQDRLPGSIPVPAPAVPRQERAEAPAQPAVPSRDQQAGRAPAGPQPPAPPAAGSTLLSGLVGGRDGEDRLLVAGSFGCIAVDTPTHLPHGLPVLLQFATGSGGGPVVTLFAEPGTGAEQPATLHPLAFGAVVDGTAQPAAAAAKGGGAPAPLARVWPSLTAFAQAFAAPETLPLAALLPPGFPPRVGPRLALSLLRFVQAAEGPGLLAWIGQPATAALAAAQHGPTPERLHEADEELRWLARDPPGDWRLVLLPLLGQGPPEALRFFLKKRGRPGEDGTPPPAHFLCDLSLSRLGALQLEGLLRPARFDLVLRSRRPLGPALQGELTGLFLAASEAGGLSGSFRFQEGEAWHPLPVPQPASREAGLSV
ncbi:hypothetical protein SAMN06265365_12459 [Tistlia consotensis]|uniref:Uncharacterized protein n=1 Tax=Tistlia consotensis USBA 355 TaxID=560819 RepID=A0A1Y6CK01_9PROT|nr:hypothetical protein [Tistlia consotensis]SMF67606.1 hypothetical protein SAMN05428998_12746 [Tistlia consotensis USBA 355]SNR99834.1 hypothetical protein SAMN06265365_12459 [Tistlia consotensis]